MQTPAADPPPARLLPSTFRPSPPFDATCMDVTCGYVNGRKAYLISVPDGESCEFTIIRNGIDAPVTCRIDGDIGGTSPPDANGKTWEEARVTCGAGINKKIGFAA